MPAAPARCQAQRNIRAVAALRESVHHPTVLPMFMDNLASAITIVACSRRIFRCALRRQPPTQ